MAQVKVLGIFISTILSSLLLTAMIFLAQTAQASATPNQPEQSAPNTTIQYTPYYSPTLTFLTSMGGDRGDLVISGGYAYAGNGTELSVVDVSHLSQAHTVRILRLPGQIFDLHIHDDYLYAAAGWGGLLVYDLDTPDSPKLIARHQDEQPFYKLDASGGILYAVTARSFQALDVSNPSVPVQLSKLDGYFDFYNPLFIQGNYAYVNWMVIDLSDPTRLSLAGSFLGTVREVDGIYAVADDIGCGMHGCDGIYMLYDISNPTSPTKLGEQRTSSSLSAARFAGNLLIAATSDYIEFLDISQPLTPTVLSSYPMWNWHIMGLEVKDDNLYILSDGLEILDIDDPSDPVLLDSYIPNDITQNYMRAGNIFFLRMMHNDFAHRNMQILDVGNPKNIIVYSPPVQFSGVSYVKDFHLDGEIATLLASGPHFQIWDFENASAPVYLGGNAVTNLDVADDLQLTDSRAYLMAGGMLKILDSSDPTDPYLLMVYGEEGSTGWVRALSDDLVYVSSYKWDQNFSGLFVELQIVDFTAAPSYNILGRYDAGFDRFITALEGTPTQVYMGREDGAVEIMDTSNPIIPTLTAVYSSTGDVRSLKLVSDTLFTGYWDSLHLIDVSDPYSPTLLSTIPISGTVEDVTVDGEWAYLALGEFSGMRVYNVSDPTRPVFYKHYPIDTYNVQVVGTLAYLSTQGDGLQILSLHQPSIYLPYVEFNGP